MMGVNPAYFSSFSSNTFLFLYFAFKAGKRSYIVHSRAQEMSNTVPLVEEINMHFRFISLLCDFPLA